MTTAIAAAAFFMRQNQVADEFRAVIGCGFAGIGLAGIICGVGLIRLPNQFYLSERSGRRLVELAGVKSPTGIRAVAVGIVLLCLIFLAAGIYWLLFE